MDVYGHLFPGQAAQTVHYQPDMDVDEPIALRATGTYDTEPTDHQQYPQQWQRETVRHGAKASETIGLGGSATTGKQTLQAVDHDCRQTVGAPPVVCRLTATRPMWSR